MTGRADVYKAAEPSLQRHTLVLVGVKSCVPCKSESVFRLIDLPFTTPQDELVSTVAIRAADGRLDRSQVVAVLVDANEDKADGASRGTASARDSPSSRLERSLHMATAVRSACPHAFILLWHEAAVEDPELRIAAFAAGASMVSCFAPHVDEALRQLASIGRAPVPGAPGSKCVCAWCGLSGLTPTELWHHVPLHHVHDPNISGRCCVCGLRDAPNLAVHLHEEHAPGGPRHEARTGLGAGVVVHRRTDNKFLMVQEFAAQGFWVPGGMADEGESIRSCAVRECLEEAGVEVELRGVVEVAHVLDRLTDQPVWRFVTFYATVKGEGEEAEGEEAEGDGEAKAQEAQGQPPFETGGPACTVSIPALACPHSLRASAPPPQQQQAMVQQFSAVAVGTGAAECGGSSSLVHQPQQQRAPQDTATPLQPPAQLPLIGSVAACCCLGAASGTAPSHPLQNSSAAPTSSAAAAAAAAATATATTPLSPASPHAHDAQLNHQHKHQEQPQQTPQHPQQHRPQSVRRRRPHQQQLPKTLPCFESAGACWVSAEQLQRIPLRSPRIPTTWYPYFAAGGAPKPLAIPAEARRLFADVEF